MIAPIENISSVPAMKLTFFEQVAIDERAVAGGRGMDREEIEAERGDRRLDPDLARMEPVLQLAAVEHQLHRADRQAQREEAERVERLAMRRSGCDG